MATAILSTLATYPKTRTQLPAHARRQLADALIEIIGYNSTSCGPQQAVARQPGAQAVPAHPDTDVLPQSDPASPRSPNVPYHSKDSISLASKIGNELFPGAALQSRARSQSPAAGTRTDADTSSGRSASLPPAISESQLKTQSLLSSPGSPRRHLKSFAQRAIERLQEARPASPAGSANTSVPPCVPANQLHVPESLHVSQHDLEGAASAGPSDGSVHGTTDTEDCSHAPHLLDFDSASLDKIHLEQEGLQQSLSGAQPDLKHATLGIHLPCSA